MNYISTRGAAPSVTFKQALLAGLATDGGLYIPQQWPQWSHEDFSACFGQPFHVVAAKVLHAFIDNDIPFDIIQSITLKAQNSFQHPATTPLIQIAPDQFLLELFHGPTLAFKDVAMQIIAPLIEYTLKERNSHATVIAATSGDTGSAAIDAFKGIQNVDVVVLYPHGRVSEVQRRQMTTSGADNIHTLAVDGTFDDCQNIVKTLFNDQAFRTSVNLTGVNSINWARIASQIVYYITSSVALGAPNRDVSFIVPTGNFGDIYAGYAAMKMGLPIHTLAVATNQNDILARTFATQIYSLEAVVPTTSPSMDIQISSNFERLLYDAYNGAHTTVIQNMNSLKSSGSFTVEEHALEWMKKFMVAHSASETEVTEKIKSTFISSEMLVDPHTAVGLVVADKIGQLSTPRVTLATAHPAKFPDAVYKASLTHPPLPLHLSDLYDRKEKITLIENDSQKIAEFIKNNTYYNKTNLPTEKLTH